MRGEKKMDVHIDSDDYGQCFGLHAEEAEFAEMPFLLSQRSLRSMCAYKSHTQESVTFKSAKFIV